MINSGFVDGETEAQRGVFVVVLFLFLLTGPESQLTSQDLNPDMSDFILLSLHKTGFAKYVMRVG